MARKGFRPGPIVHGVCCISGVLDNPSASASLTCARLSSGKRASMRHSGLPRGVHPGANYGFVKHTGYTADAVNDRPGGKAFSNL